MPNRYRPNVTVACVIHCHGQFLLVEELIDGHLRLNQPAGHLEANESLVQACQREVVEETGLTLVPDALVGIYQFSATQNLAFLRFTFAVNIDKCLEPSPQDKQIQRACWLTLDQIIARQAQHRSPLVLQSIQDYLQGQTTDLALINATLL